MSSPYTVQYGDTLTSIAKRHGFSSWRDIYYHTENESFRRKRPNPDKIYPGDVLILPDRMPGGPPGGSPLGGPPGQVGEYTGFTQEQIETVRNDLVRCRQMLDVVLHRLRALAALSPRGELWVTPRSVEYYDTKLKVFNVFKVNTFTADDFPVPEQILAGLRNLRLPGRGGAMPGPFTSPADALHFNMLLENFMTVRSGLDRFFPKLNHPRGTEPRCGLYAAFVIDGAPWDPTMHFCSLYFTTFVTADGRAVTLAHERAHTLLRIGGHPVSGDNPFCVYPHLGHPGIVSYDQASRNAYCYEWLTYALQRNYNPTRHVGAECGT